MSERFDNFIANTVGRIRFAGDEHRWQNILKRDDDIRIMVIGCTCVSKKRTIIYTRVIIVRISAVTLYEVHVIL